VYKRETTFVEIVPIAGYKDPVKAKGFGGMVGRCLDR
jgi:hypothetical protein